MGGDSARSAQVPELRQPVGQRADIGGDMDARRVGEAARGRGLVAVAMFATAVAALAALAIPWAFKDTVIDLRHIVSSLLFVLMYEP